MKKSTISLISAIFIFQLIGLENIHSQNPETDTISKRLEWFGDAKLGIFIHWGIYGVNGIDESWSFFNGLISYDDYMKQLDGFTAENYKPEEWAKLIKESGARYSVITSKHHDGVALWDSRFSDLNVVKKTPANSDLLEPFVESLRKEKIKVGLYYSLLDWSHPDYPNFTKTEKRYENDSVRWERFVEFNFGQIEELMDNYNPDLIWFDGDWEQSAEKWQAKKIRELLLQKNPNVIINSRLQGYGDYATPEQGLPIYKPQKKYWELCMTMNDSWGYQGNDKNYKSPYQIIRIFADVVSHGGNLLLDIGPKPDGTIPEEQVHILKELGKWTNKHDQAIFETKHGIPREYFDGPSTLSADGKTLYLFVTGKPNGPIMLKGLKNKINSVWVVGSGIKLSHDIKMKAWWSKTPGLVFIDIPDDVLDEYITVIALGLADGEIDLFK
jgi:alpha-L-fucosidase